MVNMMLRWRNIIILVLLFILVREKSQSGENEFRNPVQKGQLWYPEVPDNPNWAVNNLRSPLYVSGYGNVSNFKSLCKITIFS